MDPLSQPPSNNVMSVDASPRPDSSTTQNDVTVNVSLDIPSPPIDWKFNVFLGRLARDITGDEFQEMKQLFTRIIGKGVLERIQTTSELFNILRQRCFLDNNNLLYLQAMLFELKRRDLVKQCVEYARTIGNVVHFTTSQQQPADGFRFVRFHVEGQDYTNCTRAYIEGLRHLVAGILFVPAERVFVAGVEPSSSLLVVLMIPDMYVEVLVDLLIDKANLDELVQVGVDVIGIEEQQYNIRGVDGAEIVLNDQQEKLANVYQQLETKTKQLEEREIECIELRRQIQTTDSDHLERDGQLTVLQKMFNEVRPADIPKTEFTPAKLASQAALNNFKSTLKFAEHLEYEKDFILALLEANTTVIVNRLNESYQLRFTKLRFEIADLQSSVIPLHMDLQKYQFVTQINSGELDEILFESLANAIERKLKAEVTISLSVHYLQATSVISRKLRWKEKMKLKEQYDWPKDDPLSEPIEKEPNLFLCCIYLKEVEKRAEVVDPVPFFTDQLNQVGRKDLAAKLQTMTSSPIASGSKLKRKVSTGKRGKRGQSPHVRIDKSAAESSDDQETQLESISNKVDQIQNKVESIYEVLNEIQGKPPSYASLCADTSMYPPFASKRYQYRNVATKMQSEESRDTTN